jgi:hypothetical protein
MNIVTSICVDEIDADVSYYPNAKYMSSQQRRIAYWKCVVVFFSTSVRCNSAVKHLLFTNDTKPIIIQGVDIRQFLTGLQVEIVYLPFKYFKVPSGVSDIFLNAFYKLDVMKALGSTKYGYSLLLDSDCVWVKHNPELYKIIETGKFFLYEVYSGEPSKKNVHGISRIDRGRAFKEADPGYTLEEAPIHFGGEIVGTSSQNFKWVSDEMLAVFRHIVHTFDKHTMPMLKEKESILDSDEQIASLVYNKLQVDWVNAEGYLRRIWTGLNSSLAKETDLNITIWHVPKEKTQGIPFLVKQVLNKKSRFWTIDLSELNVYLGKYLGIPKRTSHIEKYLFLLNKLKTILHFYLEKHIIRKQISKAYS